jgi:hypothetical protein
MKQKTMRDVMLEGLIREIEATGERAAITDRCHDRGFCTEIGVKYSDSRVYTLIREEVVKYKAQKAQAGGI